MNIAISPIKFNNSNQSPNTIYKGTNFAGARNILATSSVSTDVASKRNHLIKNVIRPNLSSLITKIFSSYTRLKNDKLGKIIFKYRLRHYDSKIVKNIMSEILNANRKYQLNYDLRRIKVHDNDQKDIILFFHNQTSKDNFFLFFDRFTGELVSLDKDENTKVRIKEGQIIHSVEIDAMGKEKTKEEKGSLFFYGLTRTITDLDGNFLGKTEIKTAPCLAEYEINEYDSNGRKYKTGLAEYDNLWGTHVERSFVSLDGTKTDYVYADDTVNRFLYYKITDKTGKILYENTEKFKELEPNHYLSTNNQETYDIQFTNDTVVITKLDKNDMTENKVIYNIKEYTEEDYNNNTSTYLEHMRKSSKRSLISMYEENGAIERHTVDKNLLPILKQLTGEEWFNLDYNNVEFIRKCNYFEDNAQSLDGGIEIGQDCINLATLEHEIGHEILSDFLYSKELLEIFDEEKSLCEKFLPKIELDLISYIINNEAGNKKSLNEPLAEINKNRHSPEQDNDLGPRAIYTVKNLPRILAYIVNKKKARNNIE